MSANTELLHDISKLLEKCDLETLISINQISKVLVTLSAAQLEYLLELLNLLFCQPTK